MHLLPQGSIRNTRSILESHLDREYLRPKPDIILQLTFISYKWSEVQGISAVLMKSREELNNPY